MLPDQGFPELSRASKYVMQAKILCPCLIWNKELMPKSPHLKMTDYERHQAEAI
jgi:hypothetical protein